MHGQQVEWWFEKLRGVALHLAYLQYSISRNHVMALTLEDFQQEALFKLYQCLVMFRMSKKLLPKCFLAIRSHLIQLPIYKGDLVRVPYYVHYHNWKGKGDRVTFFNYCPLDVMEKETCIDRKGDVVEQEEDDDDECLPLLKCLCQWLLDKGHFGVSQKGRHMVEVFKEFMENKIKYNHDVQYNNNLTSRRNIVHKVKDVILTKLDEVEKDLGWSEIRQFVTKEN